MVENDPYAETDLYDIEYRDHTDDIAYYVALANALGGPVLELGCGNGRIVLPTLHAGRDVLGVDRSPAMLGALREKLATIQPSGQGQLFLGDFTTIDLNTVVPLITLPFNAIHHCHGLETLDALFHNVRRHLAPAGTFAFDCYLPDEDLYRRPRGVRYEERVFIHPLTGEPIDTWEEGWWDETTRVHHVVYVYQFRSGRVVRVHLPLFMFERDVIATALENAGFTITYEASTFQGDPVTPTSLKWIVRAQRSRS